MVEQQFQPIWSENQLRQFNKLYAGRGHLLSPEYKEQIEQHSAYYNVPFYEGNGSITGTIAEVGKGIIEGFTASLYRPEDAPKSQSEAIARKIGHLVGFAPGILSGPFGKLAKAARTRNLTSVARGTDSIARLGQLANEYSIPMWTANKAQKLVGPRVNKALKVFNVDDIDKLTPATKILFGGATKNIAQQAFHLGVASGVGGVRDSFAMGSVAPVWDAFTGGAQAGAVFGGIGNLIGPGMQWLNKAKYSDLKKMSESTNTKTLRSFETGLKTIAGSLFQGQHAASLGASTPEQVYEYLLGAYFGGHAQPWKRAAALKFRNEIIKKGKTGSAEDKKLYEQWSLAGRDVEQHPDFKNQPLEVQAELKSKQKELFGDPEDNAGQLGARILSELEKKGMKVVREAEKLTEEGFLDEGEYVDGRAIVRIKESDIKHNHYSATTGTAGDGIVARILGEFGIPSINYIPSRKAGDRVVGLDRVINQEQIAEANSAINKAAESPDLHTWNKFKNEFEPRDLSKMTIQQRGQIAKSYWAVKNAKSLYLISQISNNRKKIVDSWNIWAERMAKDMGKDIYAFDMPSGKWAKWAPSLNRYVIIPGKNIPPKPPKGMAVLARNDVSKFQDSVQPGVQRFFNTYFKKQPITDALASIIKSTEKNKKGQIKKLELEAETLKKGLESAKKDGNPDIIENLNKQLEENKSKIESLQGESVKEVIDNSIQETNKETEFDIEAHLDFEKADTRGVGKRALQFVTKYLEPVWIKSSDTLYGQREARIELTNEIEYLLNEYGEKGSRNIRSKELLDEISSLLEVKYELDPKKMLTENAEGTIRQWLASYNLGKRVIHLRSANGTVARMTDDANPVTAAGTRKMQEGPELMIERVAKEAGVNVNDIALMMLDHTTITAKDGRLMDVDLSRYRSTDKAGYDRLVENAHEWANKNDMYIFGGAGDKDRLYFAKYHPRVNEITMADLIRTKAISAKELKESRLFTETSKEVHDKAYLSNILYDMSLNGLDINIPNLKKMLTEPGFINTSKNHNKRAQIWFTNAFPGDKEFVKKNYVDTNNKSLLNDNEKYNAIIVKDLAKELKDYGLKSLDNIENPEHVDGAIIVSDKLLDVINKDAGVPESGQNKSFIISPNAEHGALLGKFMFHSAGPGLSKMMEAKGLHMIMQKSAVKQRGTREIGDYFIKNGKLDIQAKTYEISPEDLRMSYSVYGSDHFFEPQRLPKQVMMNMLSQSMEQGVINDSFESIIGERWTGNKDWNKKLEDYLQDSAEGIRKETAIKDLMDNIEKIGVAELIGAMKNKDVPELTEAIYQKMLKINKEHLEDSFIEGDLNAAEYKESMAELNEFNSITDRVIKIGNKISKQAAESGIRITADSIYNHKFVRDFRMKAVQNFIVNTATKPHMGNSGVAFMRPYDKAMQVNLDKANELLSRTKIDPKTGKEVPNKEGANHNDEVFFLDEGHKKTPIWLKDSKGVEYKKPKRLEEVYNEWLTAKGKRKKYLDEVLTAATVRIPMDSISGMQIMRFGGFTGRKGHGILMHSRAMRAEGGADLDGDKSFYFFGGTRGMSKEMMQEFYKNKGEFDFKDKSGNIITKDNKKAKAEKNIGRYKKGTSLRDILTIQDKSIKDFAATKGAQYSPYERIRISEAAVDGRNQLGPAVSNAQLMKAAYNSILGAGGKDNLILRINVAEEGQKANWKTFKVEVEAKTGERDIKLQRDIGRAQLGLASDPMDEIGLTDINAWKKLLWDSYFKTSSVKEIGAKKESKYKKHVEDYLSNADKLPYRFTQSGIFGHMTNLNKALWGRDWVNNRSFHMEEIFNLTKSGAELDFIEGASNSFLPKIGSRFVGLEWGDSPFTRFNRQALLKMYTDYNNSRKDMSIVKQLLDRSTDKVEQGDYIGNVMEYKLYDFSERNKIATSWIDFQSAVKETYWGKRIKKEADYANELKGDYTKRLDVLKELNTLAEDFIVNDVSDIVSLEIINDIMKGGKISPERFKTISEKVEQLKKSSYLMARTRKKLDKIKEEFDDEGSNYVDEVYDEAFGIEPKKTRTSKDQVRTAELDQAEIDAQIQQFRTEKALNANENFLFDQLMLGSQNRGSVAKKIKQFESNITDYSAIPLDYIKYLRWLNSKTGISRLGFSSLSINDSSIEYFLRRYMEKMNQNQRSLTAEELKELEGPINDAVAPEKAIPDKLQELATNTGFEGVPEKGKLKDRKLASLAVEIADLLRQHPDIVGDKTGKSLNEFLRGLDLTNKDFDAMTIDDFKTLRNWLRITKEGTIWQRAKRFFRGEEEGKALSWRSWQQLPRTVNRELMANDIKLLKKEGFFTDRTGTRRLGVIKEPTQFMDQLSNSISRMIESGTAMGDDLVTRFQEGQLFYQGLEKAPALWEIAVTTREADGAQQYKARATKRGKPEAEIKANVDYLYKRRTEARKAHNWSELQNDKFWVTLDGKRQELSGKDIVGRINETLTDFMETSHNIISGRKGAMDVYFMGWYDKDQLSPKYNHDRFLVDVDTYLNGKVPNRWKKFMASPNESIPDIFGIDGVRAMMREMYIDYQNRISKNMKKKGIDGWKAYQKSAKNLSEFPIKKTGKLDYRYYFPRMFFDKVQVSDVLKNAQKKILNDASLDAQSKADELVKIQKKFKRLDGDYHFENEYHEDVYDRMMEKLPDIVTGKSTEKLANKDMERWFANDVTMGNMMTRDASTPGWSIAPTSIEAYARSLGNTYFRGLASMISRDIVSNPDTGIYNKLTRGNKWTPEQAKAWEQFAKLFVNDAVGNPVTVTDKMVNDPAMALKLSPYRFWADNRAADAIDNIAKKVGLGKIDKDIYKKQVDMHTLRRLSQMEAKYEMASLLAHPKSAVANLLGGTLHNIQSVGIGALRNVYNYEYLQTINPELKTRKDVENFAIRSGVLPQWLIYELGLQKEFQTTKGKEVLEVIKGVIDKNPDVTFNEAWKTVKTNVNQVSDKLSNVAAKFMTIPERRLRTDAFMSHYIHAWNKFGGAIQDPNHPILIQMGKKGVSATQFMYSAPFRPAFARTALGKVFTRFQMYAWNSLALRGDVKRRIKAVGYDPNTEEGKQAGRFIMGDMFMLAMANTFAYSIFENNLPQPWGWFQDTSEWLFGDEKERDRAFFGMYPTAIAPLQIITPPIARGPLSAFNALMYDDWSRFADYYVYTLFPFGRLGRDLVGPGGISEAPIRAVDKLTGLPLLNLQRMSSKTAEKSKGTYPRSILGGYE